MIKPNVTGLASTYHHIIILALFPKFNLYRWLVLWVGGWWNHDLTIVIQTNEFSNTDKVVLVWLSQFAVVQMSF